MGEDDAVVTVSADHAAAGAAIKRLVADGFALTHLSLVGKGCHAGEKIAGFCSISDRVRFWGSRGTFWGRMWGLFLGSLSAVGAAMASNCDCKHRQPARQHHAIRHRHQGRRLLNGGAWQPGGAERARVILGVMNAKQIEMHLMAPALSRARQAAAV